MTAYVIADIKVTDDSWVPAYAASVHDLVHKHGGKYLSRSGNVKTLEGKPLDTTLIALMAFPSAAAAEAFVTDPAIRSLRRGPPGRQRKPLPDDRRHRSGRNDPVPAQGLRNDRGPDKPSIAAAAHEARGRYRTCSSRDVATSASARSANAASSDRGTRAIARHAKPRSPGGENSPQTQAQYRLRPRLPRDQPRKVSSMSPSLITKTAELAIHPDQQQAFTGRAGRRQMRLTRELRVPGCARHRRPRSFPGPDLRQ